MIAKSKTTTSFSRKTLFAILVILGLSGCDITQGTEPAPTRILPTAIPTLAIETDLPFEPTSAQMPNEGSGVCDHPYWPVYEGASWVYSVYENHSGDPGPSYEETWTVWGVEPVTDRTQFQLKTSNTYDDASGTSDLFSCDQSGIYNSGLEMLNSFGAPVMVLPTGGNFYPGFTWNRADGAQYLLHEYQVEETPFGVLPTITFGMDDPFGMGTVLYKYAEGIGLIELTISSDTITIVKKLSAYSSGTGNEISPTPYALPQNTGEALTRYIMADIQLGSVYDYYLASSQPEASEAIRRWDQGIRVVNIGSFERKVVGNYGWQITYLGSDQYINGMDVQLSDPPVVNTPAPANLPPYINNVILRNDRSSGHLIIWQDIFFQDVDGDANYVHYRLVNITAGYSATTQDGNITMSTDQVNGTMLSGKWVCGGGTYDTTLEVVIYDMGGHTSNSVSYTMSCN